MELIENFLLNHKLGCFLAAPQTDFDKGKNFFQNHWFAQLFIEKVCRISAFHTNSCFPYNDVKIYKTALIIYKREMLVSHFEYLMQDQCLLRTFHVNSFFNTLIWYICALNLFFPNSWGKNVLRMKQFLQLGCNQGSTK